MKLIRILAYIRLALVPLAVAKVALDRDGFPTSRYELAAWLVVAAGRLSRSCCWCSPTAGEAGTGTSLRWTRSRTLRWRDRR